MDCIDGDDDLNVYEDVLYCHDKEPEQCHAMTSHNPDYEECQQRIPLCRSFWYTSRYVSIRFENGEH